MTTDTLSTYCPECDCEVLANITTRPATLPVRGERVMYDELIAACPRCGTAIGDARIMGENLERAYAVYRRLHGLLSPGEIRSLRNLYGLSLREFSRFLGFGEQTVYRYEHGDLPDQVHNNTLLEAQDIRSARRLLDQNRAKLSPRSIERIERRIQELSTGVAQELRPLTVLEQRENWTPSSVNGFRSLDLHRVYALASLFARKCINLYQTKLQKALFFIDRLSYELTSRSFTGLTYAHAPHGPIVDRKDDLYYLLSEQNGLSFVEQGWGEILEASSYGQDMFDESEMALIHMVSSFMNTFDNVAVLSDLTHQLSCWKETSPGAIIDYECGNGEVGPLIRQRLNWPNGSLPKGKRIIIDEDSDM